MRSAVVQLPESRTAGERRQVMRAAIRQLERADIYLAAITSMAIEDAELDRAVRKLRSDLESVRRYVSTVRAAR